MYAGVPRRMKTSARTRSTSWLVSFRPASFPGLPTFQKERHTSMLVAGARFVPDSDSVRVVSAHWRYAGVKQETREMVRVGLAA